MCTGNMIDDWNKSLHKFDTDLANWTAKGGVEVINWTTGAAADIGNWFAFGNHPFSHAQKIQLPKPIKPSFPDNCKLKTGQCPSNEKRRLLAAALQQSIAYNWTDQSSPLTITGDDTYTSSRDNVGNCTYTGKCTTHKNTTSCPMTMHPC